MLELNHTNVHPVFVPFKPKSKKFKKRMEIFDNNTLVINKVKTKHSGLYSCNTTRLNDTDNSTISISYNYLTQVIEKDVISELPSGSLTDWRKYRENVLEPAALKLDDESLEDQIAGLNVTWSPWSSCLCGSFKFDTRRFRYAYPYVIVNESDQLAPIFPTQSEWLMDFYPYFASIVMNLTIFYEYERCVEDCVPDALEEDVDYKYEQSVYLPEGSDTKFLCPESENASEVLWVINEETVLSKSPNALGTGASENHVAVDMRDELFLTAVRPSEAGIFSCIVDMMPIKKITVTIIPKSIFLTKGA
ncbi:unnamed protein product [Hermetia illucens]|nr:unnamed protein product [Hermetia illucens]